MSKHETPMTRWYWQQVGGTLIEEFKAATKDNGSAQRLIDGVIILGEENIIASNKSRIDLTGKDVVAIQAKNQRLGMYLLGQALFTKHLLEKNFNPRSVKTVALCSNSDAELLSIVELHYPFIDVVVVPKLDDV